MERNGKYRKYFLVLGLLILFSNQIFSQIKLTASEGKDRSITPSKIYAQYSDFRDVIAMEVQNLKIDSSHKITVTLLVAEDSIMREQLKADFNLRFIGANEEMLDSTPYMVLYRNKNNLAERPVLHNGKLDLSRSCILMPVKFPHQLRILIINGNFETDAEITFDYLTRRIRDAIAVARKNNDKIIIIQN